MAKHRIKTTLQSETAECGLACLCMILSAYGRNFTLYELRETQKLSINGSSLYDIIRMADFFDLSSRPVKLGIDELRCLKLPAILHWNMNHFIVLEKINRRGFIIHDPASGRQHITYKQVNRSFTGVALELSPTVSFSTRVHEGLNILGFLREAPGVGFEIFKILAVALGLQLFGLGVPLINQAIVDSAISTRSLPSLNGLAFGLALFIFSIALIQALSGLSSLYLGSHLSEKFQTALLRRALKLPIGWFERRHLGDIISRFSSVNPIQDFMINSFVAIVIAAITILSSSVMMLVYSARLFIVAVIFAAFLSFIRVFTFSYSKGLARSAVHLSSEMQTYSVETIRGVRAFKVFCLEEGRLAQWRNKQMSVLDNQIAQSRVGVFSLSGQILIGGAQQVITLLLGGTLVITGKMSLGMLFAFQSFAAQFSSSISSIISHISKAKMLDIHFDRLSDIMSTTTEYGSEHPVDENKAFRGSISIRSLEFGYSDKEPPILSGVDVDIDAGEFVCIVGPSGQGKSTLIKILLGLYKPDSGGVFLDGIPIYEFGLRSARSNMACVMQDDQLFAGTIADNIAFFDPVFDMKLVREVSRKAQIAAVIESLPMGYETLIGDLGSSLSAGQRQRILIARALYRQPAVLVLDEGTANLDIDTERRVMETISDLPITRIVVTHREGGMVGAHRIFKLAGGALHQLPQAELQTFGV